MEKGIVLIGIILLCRVAQSFTGKSCSKHIPTDSVGVVFFLAVQMGLSALSAAVILIMGVLSGEVLKMPSPGLLISTATGISLTVTSICSLLAMQGASLVLSSLFGMAGLLIPTVAGIFLYDQTVSVGQWLGIGLLFMAAMLLASSSQKTNGKLTGKTLLLLFGSMLANGCTMLFQTLFAARVPGGNVSLYSFLQFGIPAITLLILSMGMARQQKVNCPKMDKKLFGYTLGAAAAVFVVSQTVTVASRIIPAAVLFPLADGGYTIISAIVGAAVFREKLTFRSVCGIVIGIAGLTAIKLFM